MQVLASSVAARRQMAGTHQRHPATADRVGALLRRALEKSGVKKYYRLRVLCEAKLDSPCCTYEGVEHGLGSLLVDLTRGEICEPARAQQVLQDATLLPNIWKRAAAVSIRRRGIWA